jgi:hypothetical protein
MHKENVLSALLEYRLQAFYEICTFLWIFVDFIAAAFQIHLTFTDAFFSAKETSLLLTSLAAW